MKLVIRDRRGKSKVIEVSDGEGLAFLVLKAQRELADVIKLRRGEIVEALRANGPCEAANEVRDAIAAYDIAEQRLKEHTDKTPPPPAAPAAAAASGDEQ